MDSINLLAPWTRQNSTVDLWAASIRASLRCCHPSSPWWNGHPRKWCEGMRKDWRSCRKMCRSRKGNWRGETHCSGQHMVSARSNLTCTCYDLPTMVSHAPQVEVKPDKWQTLSVPHLSLCLSSFTLGLLDTQWPASAFLCLRLLSGHCWCGWLEVSGYDSPVAAWVSD